MSTVIAEQKHWPRWTTASIARHFFVTKESDVEFYLEGTLRMDVESIATDLMELRIDGPHMRQTSAGVWVLEVSIGILMVTVMSDNDMYKHLVNVGNIADDMLNTIEVYKYGSGGDDDGSLAWCITREGEILIRHFGQPDDAKLLQQSSVEGTYLVTLQV